MLSANAVRVLQARYLRRDESGCVIESPEQLFERVARAVAEAELRLGTAREAARWEAEFHGILTALDFLPNSPTLMNAGTPRGQLGACFVVPVEDSMEGIFGALRAMALLQRAGGGTGFSFSGLRPRGDVVASTGGQASGPVSFMRVFDCATEHIKQGGRRRGANMAVLRSDHPDVLEFIEAKLDGTALQNFNLSLGVSDAFMEAVRAGNGWTLRHPRSGRPVGRVPAREIFERAVSAAWTTGDPGMLYLDAIDRSNPTPARGRIEATNPCGEVPLLPWETCVLGSVNLSHMVRDGQVDLDWERLRRTVHLGIRFLDDVVEVNHEALPEIVAAARGGRKIGLGVMGFAECLVELGIPYDSEEAVGWAGRIAAFIRREADDASRALAEARGVFPAWEGSVYAIRGDRIRNATRLSMAPTGTLSIIAGTSGGIEPLFALAYLRHHGLGGAPLAEVNPIFLRYAERQGLDMERLADEVLATGRLRDLPWVPAPVRQLFVTATEIAASHHLRIQAAFQRHVDNAVSKTINLPETADRGEVARIYLEAWQLGLKGVTVYRSGTAQSQVLTVGVGDTAANRELFTRCDPGACRL